MDPTQAPNNSPLNTGVPQDPMTASPQPIQPAVTPTMPSQSVVPPTGSSFTTTPPVQQNDPSMPQQPMVPVQPDQMNNPFQQGPSDPFAQQPSFMQPDIAPLPPTPGWKRFIKPAIIILVAIIILIGGYVAYTVIKSNMQKTATTNATDQAAQSTQTSTPEVNTLKSFTLVAPDTSKTQGMTATQVQAATKLTSSDGNCTLIYGIESQEQLPGMDIGDTISLYLNKLKKQSPHLVVNGPNKAAALILKGTDGKSYSLPTVNFTYTDSTQAGAANATYSISLLSDGSHAVVASICGSDTAKSAADLQSKVDALQAAATTIKVQVQ